MLHMCSASRNHQNTNRHISHRNRWIVRSWCANGQGRSLYDRRFQGSSTPPNLLGLCFFVDEELLLLTVCVCVRHWFQTCCRRFLRALIGVAVIVTRMLNGCSGWLKTLARKRCHPLGGCPARKLNYSFPGKGVSFRCTRTLAHARNRWLLLWRSFAVTPRTRPLEMPSYLWELTS